MVLRRVWGHEEYAPLWRLSQNVINVQIPFEITLNCDAQNFMSIDWHEGIRVYGQGWWEMVYDSTKTQSHLLALFGVKNHIVCNSQSADVIKLRLQNWHLTCRCKFWYSDIIYILPVWATRGGQFQIVNHYNKKYRTQFGPLRDTAMHREPIGDGLS